MNASAPRTAAARIGRLDTLALRLFLLMWLALAISHAGAWLVVTRSAALWPPSQHGPGDLPPPSPSAGPAPPPPPRSGSGPPMPTFPSLPPELPTHAMVLDYAVRLVLIALCAWWGSRWLARPMKRLVAASDALVPALSRGEVPPQLDESSGTHEVRAAASVFNRMAAQIRQLFEGRGLMIAAISHDLRTPLTRMRMRVETADLDGGVRQRCVADLREMNALIDTVLEVFRGSSRDGGLATRRTDIGALLQALVDDRAEVGGDVVFEGPAAEADTDPLALRRLVGNLVDNALRYAGTAGTTRVVLRAEPQALVITVDDRGPGIPAGRLNEMLQPFVRLDGSRNTAGGGTGLGLFIAHELAQRLGGSLSLANRAGGGLRAEVWLPRRPPA